MGRVAGIADRDEAIVAEEVVRQQVEQEERGQQREEGDRTPQQPESDRRNTLPCGARVALRAHEGSCDFVSGVAGSVLDGLASWVVDAGAAARASRDS